MSHPQHSAIADEWVRSKRTELAAEQRQLLEELAFQYGDSPDSYLATEPHGECVFWGDTAAATMEVDRGNWHAPGGLLSSPEQKESLIQHLADLAKQERQVVSVYSVGESERPLFEDNGFEATKFGEEPYLDLTTLTWSGKPYEWVRRQTNYCRRQNVIAEEIDHTPHNTLINPNWTKRPTDVGNIPLVSPTADEYQKLTDELDAIQLEDFAGRAYEHPLRLFEGQFFPRDLYRRRLFVARQEGTNRIEAFCVTNPMQNGAWWAIEMYRKRNDAVRGVVPFLMREIIDQFKAEGVHEVSLCMIPGRGLKSGTSRESSLARWALGTWYWLSPKAFDIRGQEHFKTRFRPEFKNRYMCIAPGASLWHMFSFMRVCGAMDISLWKFIKVSLSWKSTPKES
ncbi:MAG: DUF2156 domain-containing protein [Planctomycetaceae bacterium]|nr:DUF2156 domain-containing protein [Planctomycetaceae bacterium]MCB9950788.1 DUF2156 domain-containing protein [Planctomycetaceae bacterium]